MKRVAIKRAAEAAPLVLALALMLAGIVAFAIKFESEPFRAWAGLTGLGAAAVVCLLYSASLQPGDSGSMGDDTADGND